nr:hypothetical protein [Tanacetum cinerariifolium]
MLEDLYVEVAFQAPPSPDYIPGPKEPEHADDEIVAEDQPYAKDASPNAQSLEYVPESDFKAHLEDDDDEDPEISIPAPVHMPAWSDLEIVRLIAMSSPPASLLSSWSSPPPQIPFPPLPRYYHHLHLYEAASSSSPPLQLPSASRREDRPEVTLPPRKKLVIALGPGYEIGESSSTAAARPAGGLRADYDFVVTMDREIMRDPEREKQMAPKRTTRSTADQETINATSVTNAQQQAMIDQGVTAALAARDALRSTNGDDSHNSRTGVRRTERATRECTYTDFLKCQPLPVKGTEGVASLSQWCERMEFVFHISNCATVGHEAAYGMSWKTLMKMMTDKYCPRNEIRKLEMELWDLKVKGTDLTSYTQRFQELALLCGRMFSKESDKIEKYIGGLPNMIHGSVVASKPKTMHEAIEITTELMDKKIHTFAERETASKRKFENTSRNTQNQQQQSNKRQNTGRVYTAESSKKKQYGGSKPLCAKCNYHHDGPCALKCRNCNKIGHFARDCRSAANTNNANNQRGTRLGQKTACYECGVQGHFKRECPKLKNNNNQGNQRGRNNASARVYVVGRTGTDPDANVVTGTFLLNNRYAFVLFVTSADRSFVSTTFSTQINITPSTLDHCYDLELADGRIIGLNTTLRGCTLNLLNHQFNVNLMPVELGSFDPIIGMDWLAKYQAVIVCAEKIVRIPWGNETLIIHGDGSNQGNAIRLSIISCTKTEKYVKKGFPIFLAHITSKEVEDKSKKK